ncbi:hypothetical protein OQA88_11010 [Cercophora sp. LCS_1]
MRNPTINTILAAVAFTALVGAEECRRARFTGSAAQGDGFGGAVFLGETDFYEIKIECADPSSPVTIEWQFPIVDETSALLKSNLTAGKHPGWLKNLTVAQDGTASYTWSPWKTLQNDFPSQRSPNLTMSEARAFAMLGTNYFFLHQGDEPETAARGFSGSFIVLPESAKFHWHRRFVQGQEEEKRQWVVGVSTSVPLGAILLAGAAWLWGRGGVLPGRKGAKFQPVPT